MSINLQSDGAPAGPWLRVVGIGEDGLAGLGAAARAAVAGAAVVFGAERHLKLLPERLPGQRDGQRRVPWPSPFDLAFGAVLALRGAPVCVLASGDPMWFGAGAKLAERLAAGEYEVLPAVSSAALAAARLGWPLQDLRVLRPVAPDRLLGLARVRLHLADGARLIVLSADRETPGLLAALLRGDGFGSSAMTLFERLGGPAERRIDASADAWPEIDVDPLNLIAVHCRASPGLAVRPRRAGLPDDAFAHDGQLTKRDVRAVTLSRLAPLPGELLWDVGAGCGSIAIEWLRVGDGCRAIAIEPDAGRGALIRQNAAALGVPDLVIVAGRAPAALTDLPAPDAIFIGGGLTAGGVVERCWDALRPGGRLVANAVTLETETLLIALHQRIGGELTRVQVADAAALGRFETWRPALPVTVLAATKPSGLTDVCR
jgi:precorrin-6B C5,15-methyltransferase / cobalt-precorrin-6B C5,C15-methyltransferase